MEAGFHEVAVLNIDGINRRRLYPQHPDGGQEPPREQALIDIYRVMRPGEPPTLDTAETLFGQLFFDTERYDLSAVGRVKMNMRMGLDAPDTMRVLRKEDILAILKALVELRDGRGEIDDIDNLGNRRVRSVGELMENQFRVGLLRMERAIKERMSAVDIDTVMPHDLINAKPVAAAVREFFGSSQLSQFMDQQNPLSELTHKRRMSALGPGGLTRERAGFEVRDVHPTHYGRICPIETPEGPNIGLINSLATYRARQQVRLHRKPVPQGDQQARDGRGGLSVGDGRGEVHDRPGQREVDAKRQLIDELVSCRKGGNFVMTTPDQVDFIDVSPKQLVSVAAALVPFLENDDANRALMGSNMQRQAVPLLAPKRRWSAPAWKRWWPATPARPSPPAAPAWSTRSTPPVSSSAPRRRPSHQPGIDIYRLRKFQRSNPSTCITQRPLVKVGDVVQGRHHRRRSLDRSSASWRSARMCSSPSCPGMATTSRTPSSSPSASSRDDVFTSIHIEEFETMARDTKLGPEEITRDIPNVGEENLKNLDEAGIVYIGAEVVAGDILVGKVTPKGETPMTPEEKLLRAIFGEKAADVRDTSLRVPPGVTGTIVEVRVLQPARRRQGPARHVDRAGREERLAEDRDDELSILERNIFSRSEILLNDASLPAPRACAGHQDHPGRAASTRPASVVEIGLRNEKRWPRSRRSRSR